MIYMGQEFNLERPRNVVTVDWPASLDQHGFYQWCRRLVRLRRRYPGLRLRGFDPAAAGQFEWILGPWLDESHGGGRRTVGWRAHPSDRPPTPWPSCSTSRALMSRSTWSSAGRGLGQAGRHRPGRRPAPRWHQRPARPDRTAQHRRPLRQLTLPARAASSTNGRLLSPPPDRVSSAPDAGRHVDPTVLQESGAGTQTTRGPCQRFARNCATRNLMSPHDPTLDSAFTCAVAWVGEVMHGDLNSPRLNGMQGVAGSM